MPYEPPIHHNRRSIRLQYHDYSARDLYFITICTVAQKCIFGRVVPEQNTVALSPMGKIVRNCLLKISEHNERAVLHEWVIMPNHLHFILQVAEGNKNNVAPAAQWGECDSPLHSSAQTHSSEFKRGPVGANHIRPNNARPNGTSDSLGSIIRGFKIGVTQQIGHSIFQRNYYEHIIRNNDEFVSIADYIINNPKTWGADVLFQKSLDEFNKRFGADL